MICVDYYPLMNQEILAEHDSEIGFIKSNAINQLKQLKFNVFI